MQTDIRLIAFYLPQYYPIPENDKWWGKGFTEWTNVARAKPLFKGHDQPRFPTELGYYDLRVAEVREQQANLAREYGISGFCYWHYWFGNGKRVLDRVFNEVLESGKPNFPFCLGWANESWTGVWHGLGKKVLLEQLYPGKEDYIAHFDFLIKAFKDPRYIRVNDEPLFLVYNPRGIPDLKLFVNTFREEAVRHGLKGIHLVATNVEGTWPAKQHGFDAITPSTHTKIMYLRSSNRVKDFFRRQLNKKRISDTYKKIFQKPVHIYEYKEAMAHFIHENTNDNLYYPMVAPNWDNTARSRLNGYVLHNSTPELFEEIFGKAIKKVRNNANGEKLIFIKSWNEWAEGNYLEPDRKYGRRYLEAIKKKLSEESARNGS